MSTAADQALAADVGAGEILDVEIPSGAWDGHTLREVLTAVNGVLQHTTPPDTANPTSGVVPPSINVAVTPRV